METFIIIINILLILTIIGLSIAYYLRAPKEFTWKKSKIYYIGACLILLVKSVLELTGTMIPIPFQHLACGLALTVIVSSLAASHTRLDYDSHQHIKEVVNRTQATKELNSLLNGYIEEKINGKLTSRNLSPNNHSS